MANTSFTGPVRSQNGFQVITKNATTGEITVGTTVGENLIATGTANVIVLPTSDPGVPGALWNNGGEFAISGM